MLETLLVSELQEIKDFIGVGYLDKELFDYNFMNMGNSVAKVYVDYVDLEKSFDISVRENIVSLSDFIKVLDSKLKDRNYSHLNRYVRFSNGNIYYITDNTLLG